MLIPTSHNIKTITDMREDAIALLKKVKELGVVYLFQHSSPQAVMLSIEEFQRLHEIVEDHLDERIAQKLSLQKRGEGIPLDKVIASYKKKKSV